MQPSERNWVSMTTRKPKLALPSRSKRRRKKPRPDYALQGSAVDLPMETVLAYSPKQRKTYINGLLDALAKKVRSGSLSLKARVSFTKEMRDLRRLLYGAADQYLYVDDKTNKRNVLGKGSPGATHTYWSQTE